MWSASFHGTRLTIGNSSDKFRPVCSSVQKRVGRQAATDSLFSGGLLNSDGTGVRERSVFVRFSLPGQVQSLFGMLKRFLVVLKPGSVDLN